MIKLHGGDSIACLALLRLGHVCRIGRMNSLYLPIDRQACRDAAFSAALG
jgi:hypothetical protein